MAGAVLQHPGPAGKAEAVQRWPQRNGNGAASRCRFILYHKMNARRTGAQRPVAYNSHRGSNRDWQGGAEVGPTEAGFSAAEGMGTQHNILPLLPATLLQSYFFLLCTILSSSSSPPSSPSPLASILLMQTSARTSCATSSRVTALYIIYLSVCAACSRPYGRMVSTRWAG